MTEDELKSILAAHARDFANTIVDLIRNAPLHEIAMLRAPDVEIPDIEFPVARKAPPPLRPLPPDENELSILEHLNNAGPKGSTLRAWIISEQGELDPTEHAEWESKGKAILDALVAAGRIDSKDGGKMRGTVYTLSPTP